jgi:hypothetical protein
VEIRERVGAENFFLFGLNADEVVRLKQQGYTPLSFYEHDGELKAAIDAMALGQFSEATRTFPADRRIAARATVSTAGNFRAMSTPDGRLRLQDRPLDQDVDSQHRARILHLGPGHPAVLRRDRRQAAPGQ